MFSALLSHPVKEAGCNRFIAQEWELSFRPPLRPIFLLVMCLPMNHMSAILITVETETEYCLRVYALNNGSVSKAVQDI